MTSAPATDRMEDAPDLSDGGLTATGSAPWDNTTATNIQGKGNAPSGFGSTGVWHKVTVVTPGALSFRHNTSVSGDAFLYVYYGPANATDLSQLTLIGYDDDSAGNSKPIVNVANGAAGTYWLLNTGWASGRLSGQSLVWSIPAYVPAGPQPLAGAVTPKATVTGSLATNLVPMSAQVTGKAAASASAGVVSEPPPAQTNMQDAPDISEGGTRGSGRAPWDMAYAGPGQGKDTAPGGHGVVGMWHKVTLTAPGPMTFKHDVNDSGDSYLYVYYGPADATNVNQLTLVGYDDDAAGNQKPFVSIPDGALGTYWLLNCSYGGTTYLHNQHLIWTMPVGVPTEPPQDRVLEGVVAASALVTGDAVTNLLQLEGAAVGAASASAELGSVLVNDLGVGRVQGRAEAEGHLTTLRHRTLTMFVMTGRSVDNTHEVELQARVGSDTRQISDPAPTQTRTASYS